MPCSSPHRRTRTNGNTYGRVIQMKARPRHVYRWSMALYGKEERSWAKKKPTCVACNQSRPQISAVRRTLCILLIVLRGRENADV